MDNNTTMHILELASSPWLLGMVLMRGGAMIHDCTCVRTSKMNNTYLAKRAFSFWDEAARL